MAKIHFSNKIEDTFVECFDKMYEKLGGPKFRIIEAAIEVFDTLPDEIQTKLKSYNAELREPILKELSQLGRNIKHEKQEDISITEAGNIIKHFVRYKIPNIEEQRIIDSLRAALGPENPKQKKKNA